MRNLVLITLVILSLSCKKKNNSGNSGDTPCGDHKSQQTYRESDGDCYLLNGAGNKEYVDDHECDC